MSSIYVQGSNNQVAGRDLIVQAQATAHRAVLLERQAHARVELLAVARQLQAGWHRWFPVLPLVVGMGWISLGFKISGGGALFLLAALVILGAHAKATAHQLMARRQLLVGDLEALRRALLTVP